MDAVIVCLHSEADGYDHRTVFLTDEDRRKGKVVIPAGVLGNTGKWQVWLIGENRYGPTEKTPRPRRRAGTEGPDGGIEGRKGVPVVPRMAVWQMG